MHNVGKIGDPFKYIGTISHVGGRPLDPVEDLKVTAGWGHAGKGGVTMPGKGKIIEREYSTDERKAIERGAPLLGLTSEEALAHLGERTCDVLSQRSGLLEEHPRARLGVHHRRLSGNQEMAQLSRA